MPSKAAEIWLPLQTICKFVPDTFGNFHLGTDRVGTLAVHHLVKPEILAQPAGANDIEILIILQPEHQARHLFGQAIHQLEARRQREIVVRVAFVDQQRETFVRGVGAELGQHRTLGHGRRFIGQRREQRWYFVENDFPISGFALAEQHAVKAGRRLVDR